MPIYMVIPRKSQKYALFYQLLDSNLFTHHNTYAILREVTSEIYGPRIYSPSYKFPIYFYFAIFTFNLYHKNTKNIILSSLSDLTFASGREGIDNPFIALVARFLYVCVGTRRLACSLLLDWYLGSQKLREILMLLCCIIPSTSGKTNASSRRSRAARQLMRHS